MNLAPYIGKNILITGACGYVGRMLLDQLLSIDCNITILDRPESIATLPKNLQGTLRLIPGDIREQQTWIKTVPNQEIIFHLAAQTSHYEANRNPEMDWRFNTLPIIHLAEAAKQSQTKPHVVFASSATVVGLPTNFPIDESTHCQPVTVYDIHKLASENFLNFYSIQGVLTGVALRLANVYGYSVGQSGKDRGVVSILASRALQGEPLTVFGSGEWLRDYIHVTDVVSAFLESGKLHLTEEKFRVFNVCSGTSTKFKDTVKMIADSAKSLSGKNVPIEHKQVANLSPIDERSYVGSNTALTTATDWRPTLTLQQGITNLINEMYSGQ
ncbi:MAG: NAD-dependent epimerase/dehydratase family protein [Oligoflexales bacterium]